MNRTGKKTKKQKNNGHDQYLLTHFKNDVYLSDYKATIVQFVLLWCIKVSVLVNEKTIDDLTKIII